MTTLWWWRMGSGSKASGMEMQARRGLRGNREEATAFLQGEGEQEEMRV
jgi:hypothetical protein